jgi:hypothetical protein
LCPAVTIETQAHKKGENKKKRNRTYLAQRDGREQISAEPGRGTERLRLKGECDM